MVMPSDVPVTSPRSNSSVNVLKANRSDDSNNSFAQTSSLGKLSPLTDTTGSVGRSRISNAPRTSSSSSSSSASSRTSRPPLDRGRTLYSIRHQQQHRDFYSPELDNISESESDEPARHSPSSKRHRERIGNNGKGSISSRRRNKTNDSSSRSAFTRRKRSSVSSSASETRLKALTSPSLVSVVSAVTTTTNSSSGSNATVTQHSYTSKDTMPETTSPRRRSKRGEQSSSRNAKKERNPEESHCMETANVLRYLDSEQAVYEHRVQQGQVWRSDNDDNSSSSEEEEDYDSDHSSSMTDATSVSKSSHPSPQLSLKQAKLGPATLEIRNSLQLAKIEQPVPLKACPPPRNSEDRSVYRHPTVETVKDDKSYNEGYQDEGESDEDEDDDEEDLDDEHDEDVPKHLSNSDSDDSRSSDEQAPPYSKSDEDETAKRTRRLSATAFNHIKEQSNQSYFDHVPPRAPSVPPRFIPTPDFTASGKTVVGYELLASKICSAAGKEACSQNPHPQPIYRKFESINHRILLHIQDEICELEEHLRKIDESIAQLSKNYDGTFPAASRRTGGSRYGPRLDYQRTDILGRLYMKMTQYSQALSQFKTITQDHCAAQTEEIASYRAWLKVHQVIDEVETKFLDHEEDLIRVTANPASSSTTSSSSQSSRSCSSSPSTCHTIPPQRDQSGILLHNAVLVGPASGIATYLCLQLLSGPCGIIILAMLVIAAAVYAYLQYKSILFAKCRSSSGNEDQLTHVHSSDRDCKVRPRARTSSSRQLQLYA